MSEHQRRLAAIKDSLRKVESFVKEYQSTLKQLMASGPTQPRIEIAAEITAIGRAIIWPCNDGAVVLWYAGTSEDASVEVKPVQNQTMFTFLTEKNIFTVFDEQGNSRSGFGIKVEYPRSNHIIVTGANMIEGGGTFRTRHAKAELIGWDATPVDPRTRAKEDFDAAYIAKNLAAIDIPDAIGIQPAAAAAQRAQKLLAEFEKTIVAARREEELQCFLAQHPELIYPEYVSCQRKWKLGSEYVSDFVFEIQGFAGREYIFVEIEQATKRVTVNSGQFSSEFTQAKGQLNDWESWLTHNIAYAQKLLPGYYAPTFHLIMGRSEGLSTSDRERLHNEFSGTKKRFSTYDDLLEKYRVTVDRLLSAS